MKEGKEISEDALPDEESLVRRAIAGDVDAYGILVAKYQQRVFNLISRMVGQREAAEDLAQEVFIKAYRKIGEFRFESSFFTWLYTIAVNTCRNFYRKREPVAIDIEEHEGVMSAANTSPMEAQDEVVYRRQRAKIIREALEKLPAEHREALVLCDLEGLSYQEIADIMSVPIGTVRSRIFRARTAMKGLIPEELRRQ